MNYLDTIKKKIITTITTPRVLIGEDPLRNRLAKAWFVTKHHFFPKKPFVCVAIGDSTVEGIGASNPKRSYACLVYSSIKQHNPNAIFYNLGEAGARVPDVLARQLQKAIELKPDIILVSVGTNDLIQKRNAKQFKKDFYQLMKELKQNTDALLIVNNLPDITLAPALPKWISPYASYLVKQFNKKIKKITELVGGILIDLYRQSQLFRGYKELIGPDGLHPTDLGYALWANTIITQLNSLLVKL